MILWKLAYDTSDGETIVPDQRGKSDRMHVEAQATYLNHRLKREGWEGGPWRVIRVV